MTSNLYERLLRINPLETGQVSDRLCAVKTGTVNFFVYKKEGQIVCFDSGYGKRRIIRELDRLGIEPRSVTHLFLTHSDFDHTGGVSLFESAKLFMSAVEEQMILRQRPRMLGIAFNRPLRRHYTLLKDGEIVMAGTTEVQAIATPGHTPGSMFYLVDRSVLLAGDNFALFNGKVHPLRPLFNMDTETQKTSICKLARPKGVQIACTAHSGLTTDFDAAIRGWK
jgi:glyoxylase-like metal-dependent hydrolase (beta-lactamase superfamily II)